jgi:hypothetical protein
MTSLHRKTTPPEREQRRGRPSQKTDLSRLKAPHPQPTTRTFTPPARTHPASTTGDRSLPPSWRPAIHSKIQSGRMYQVQIAEIKIHRECARSHTKNGGSQPGAMSCRNTFGARRSYSGVASPCSDTGSCRLFRTNCTGTEHGPNIYTHPMKRMYLMRTPVSLCKI